MARSGDLQITKECSEYTGRAGDFCTITSSNLEGIEAGAKVIYAEAAGEGTLDTDVVRRGVREHRDRPCCARSCCQQGHGDALGRDG